VYKIVKKSVVRTNFGFPSEFSAKTEDGLDVYMHFRYGDITIKVEGKEILKEPLDKYCLNGFLSDDNLDLIMKRNELWFVEEEKIEEEIIEEKIEQPENFEDRLISISELKKYCEEAIDSYDEKKHSFYRPGDYGYLDIINKFCR